MKRLFLMGPIGCGKSTMIRDALGEDLSRAGGFLTIRKMDEFNLLGFELVSPRTQQESFRFLDFEKGGVHNDAVFSLQGVAYLQTPAPFAVADEFGGMDLLVDEFHDQLLTFLSSDVPCIGVLKTEGAAAAMAKKVPLGQTYYQRYQTLLQILKDDPDTLLLPTSGWQDTNAVTQINWWVHRHIRR